MAGRTEQTVVSLKSRERRQVSFAQMTKVFTEPDIPLTNSERLIALVIFQHIDQDTMLCYPSVDTIKRRAKASRNTVCRTIKLLQELGLMKVEKQRIKGKFDRNVYDFSAVRTRLHRVPK